MCERYTRREGGIKRKIQEDSEMHRKNSRYTNRGMEEGRDGGEDEDKEKNEGEEQGENGNIIHLIDLTYCEYEVRIPIVGL